MNSNIFPLLALIVATWIFFGYVSPTWSGAIAEANSGIANDVDALAAANKYVEQQNMLMSSRNLIDPADLTRVTVFLPDSVDNVGLILDLNALAARSGLSLANIDVISNSGNTSNASNTANKSITQGLPTAASNPVGSVDLSLSAVGTYSALKSFLIGVERSARLLDVRDITVKGSDTGVYNYQMKLRLYWLR